MIIIRNVDTGEDIRTYKWGQILLLAAFSTGSLIRLNGGDYRIVDRVTDGLDDDTVTVTIMVKKAEL